MRQTKITRGISKELAQNLPSQSKLHWLKWFLVLIIILLAFYFLVNPLRISSANKYIDQGDKLLLEKKYISADVEYQKALTLQNNQEIVERRTLVERGATDILQLKDFYSAKGKTDTLSLMNEASQVPSNEIDAVRKCKELIESGEYQLAIIPAKTAIEMDKNYRDAWLYLGIANLKAGQNLELKPEAKEAYLAKAKESLNKAKEIDPEYEPTSVYLKLLESK